MEFLLGLIRGRILSQQNMLILMIFWVISGGLVENQLKCDGVGGGGLSKSFVSRIKEFLSSMRIYFLKEEYTTSLVAPENGFCYILNIVFRDRRNFWHCVHSMLESLSSNYIYLYPPR